MAKLEKKEKQVSEKIPISDRLVDPAEAQKREQTKHPNPQMDDPATDRIGKFTGLTQEEMKRDIKQQEAMLERERPEEQEKSPEEVQKVKREIKQSLKDIFAKYKEFELIKIRDLTFLVETLDSRHYLNDDIKLMTPEELKDPNTIFRNLYKYFVRALLKINDIPIETLIELPKGSPEYYTSFEEELKNMMPMNLILEVLNKYSEFFYKTSADDEEGTTQNEEAVKKN